MEILLVYTIVFLIFIFFSVNYLCILPFSTVNLMLLWVIFLKNLKIIENNFLHLIIFFNSSFLFYNVLIVDTYLFRKIVLSSNKTDNSTFRGTAFGLYGAEYVIGNWLQFKESTWVQTQSPKITCILMEWVAFIAAFRTCPCILFTWSIFFPKPKGSYHPILIRVTRATAVFTWVAEGIGIL